MTDERNSPGLVLRLERERKGLSTEEVAGQMRLMRSQVEALEADDYEALPGVVFVRGFIRNYAKLMQIDPAPLLESIDRPKDSIVPPKDEGIPFPSGKNSNWVHYAIGFVLVAFSVLVYEMYRGNHMGETPKPLPEATKPVLRPAVKSVLRPAVKPAAEPVSAPAAAPVSAPAAPAVSMPAPASSPVPRSAPEAAASSPIRLSFGAASWVEVSDSSGKIVFSKLSPAGSVQSVSGKAPFSLTIGNAQHVRLFYQDKPVDLVPYIKAEVAHLTLK